MRKRRQVLPKKGEEQNPKPKIGEDAPQRKIPPCYVPDFSVGSKMSSNCANLYSFDNTPLSLMQGLMKGIVPGGNRTHNHTKWSYIFQVCCLTIPHRTFN